MNESLEELVRLDRAVYEAVAAAGTPSLDAGLRRVSEAANRSALWIGVAAALAAVGGRRGRRAAVDGLASIAVASAVVNLGAKPLARRRRPERDATTRSERHVRMPGSTSFPSGHSASAFAFAEGVSATLPWVGVPLRLAAATVAYSRVHTGVHYPGDVVVGTLIGMTAGEVVPRGLARARRR
ncbi:MAG TPA: phosphatase PAP2 family protein [Candidatus Angelobacter sp.]|nr:phosphatase PAP2 family protein [Candidatus Angelobacter sp.]